MRRRHLAFAAAEWNPIAASFFRSHLAVLDMCKARAARSSGNPGAARDFVACARTKITGAERLLEKGLDAAGW